MADLQAPLYRLDRSAVRLPVDRPSTLRGPDGAPIDAIIQDLSLTGCRIIIPVSSVLDSELMIGLPGVGIRTIRVIWSKANTMGCAFDKPLTLMELQQARFAQTVSEGQFSGPDPSFARDTNPYGLDRERPQTEGVGIIAALALGAWAVFGAVLFAGYWLING